MSAAFIADQYWTLVNARFEDAGSGSRVILVQGVFQTDLDRMQHEVGWMGCLSQLAKLRGEEVEEPE